MEGSALAGVIAEIIHRRGAGEWISDESVIAAHPELMPELAEQLDALRRIEKAESEASRVTSLRDRVALRTGRTSATGEPAGGPDPEVLRDRKATERPAAMREPAEGGRATQRLAARPAASEQRCSRGAHDWLASALPGYSIAGEIHRGGQGAVYAAVQKSTGRDVAIKVLHEGPFGGPADISRFEREVQVLAQLRHRNIVTVHDSGVASGRYYFVMDFIDGRRLDEYLAGEPRPVAEVLRMFVKICDAVHAAHVLRIVHRDLKPGNILIDAHGEPHVLDFGLAKATSAQDGGPAASPYSDRTMLTITGQFVGSVQWASPEQAAGATDKIDSRSDVYSLGVLLYHALTFRYPYEVSGSLHEVLDRVIHQEPARPSKLSQSVDGEIETILLKCLSKEPDRRYQDAGELSRDLQRYLNDEPIAAKRDSRLYVLRKFARRYRLQVAAAVAFVLLLAISSVVALALYARERHAVREGRKALQEAYLREATARRKSPMPGRRLEAIAALEKALSIGSTPELLDELIAALACPDLREILHVPLHPEATWANILLDQALSRFVQVVGGHVEVLDIPEARVLLRAPGERGWISNDGRHVLISHRTGERLKEELFSWELWGVDDGKIIARLPDTTWPFAVSFSPDSRQVVVGGIDGGIRLYPCNDVALQGTFAALDERPIARACLSPDGRLLATRCEYASEAVLRRVDDDEVLARLAHPANAYSLVWSPDGQTLAVGCHDTRIYLWSAMDYRLLRVLSPGTVSGAALDWSPDGLRIVESDWNGLSRIWRADSGQLLLRMQGTCRRFGSDGRLAYFDDRRGRHVLSILDWLSSDVYKALPGSIREDDLRGFAVSPDGSLVAVARGYRIQLQNALTGDVTAELEVPGESVLFAPDSREIYTIGPGGVQRWPVQAAEQDETRAPANPVFPDACNFSALSADGRLMACHSNNRVVVLDAHGGEIRMSIDHVAGRPALTPDGRILAIASYSVVGKDLPIFSMPDGATLARLPVAGSSIASFGPTGELLAVASSSGVTLWDTKSWQPSHWQIEASLPNATALDFSHDGTRLAICVDLNRIALFDMVERRLLYWLEPPHVELIGQIKFSPDGARLYFSTSVDQIAYWDLRAIEAERAARAVE